MNARPDTSHQWRGACATTACATAELQHHARRHGDYAAHRAKYGHAAPHPHAGHARNPEEVARSRAHDRRYDTHRPGRHSHETLGGTAGMSEHPMISCLCPTRNRPAFLRQSLAYFSSQDYPNAELIIVDDSDEPTRFALQAGVRYLWLSSPL